MRQSISHLNFLMFDWTGVGREHCDTLQRTAASCNALQRTATRCNTLQRTATHCNALQHTATHCNTLQHVIFGWIGVGRKHCNTLQQNTTRCKTLQQEAGGGGRGILAKVDLAGGQERAGDGGLRGVGGGGKSRVNCEFSVVYLTLSSFLSPALSVFCAR